MAEREHDKIEVAKKKMPIDNDDNVEPTKSIDDLPKLQYAIEDVPPWYICIVLGLQHFLTLATTVISAPLIISAPLCIQVGQETDELAKAEIIGTIFVVAGINTFLQTLFGCRLPIVQGGSAAFLPPLFAIASTFGDCPTVLPMGSNLTEFYIMNPNSTEPVVINGSEEHREAWRARMRAVQGTLMVASVLEILVGFSGIMGLLLKFIGPIVITVTISLIGLSLANLAANIAANQWGIAFLTFALILIFSQYMAKIKIPSYSNGKCSKSLGYPIFQLFPVILAILVAYIVSVILTYTDVFPDDKDHIYYKARTDSRISVLTSAKWFRFPYPGQWGKPTVTVAGIFGMLAGIVASMVESIGDYYVAARLSDAPPPTTAAINRGIGMEGVGCLVAAAWGTGSGTTSFSQNIGALSITQVGSRRVIQVAAVFMVVAGVFTKFCAVLITLPDPVMGGMYLAMFGMITSVGLSNLQFVDLNSSRNLFIIGSSLTLGLGVPVWVDNNKELISTGEPIIDEIFYVLLSTGMLVGGAAAFFMDNTIPGTAEERGMNVWVIDTEVSSAQEVRENLISYDFPFGNEAIYKAKWTSYLPVCPNFLSHRRKVVPEQLNGYMNSSTRLEETGEGELSQL